MTAESTANDRGNQPPNRQDAGGPEPVSQGGSHRRRRRKRRGGGSGGGGGHGGGGDQRPPGAPSQGGKGHGGQGHGGQGHGGQGHGGQAQGGHQPGPGNHLHSSGGGGGGGGGGPNGDGRRGGKARPKHKGKGKGPKRINQLLDLLQRGTSIDPYERWHLERAEGEITTRAIDLVAPIGRGQRCLIVAPPKAGKTMMLMEICKSLHENHPEASLIALLIDERPEEVTHFKRATTAEVFASSSDQTAKQHLANCEQAMEVAIERVLAGQDVVVMLDSITRLARAQNNATRGSGKTITGGLGAETMEFPRRIFGAARKIENGGSLTIIGTALVGTGSKMDDIIFEEFKGTGNTEIMLSRQLFEKRIFPTIDIPKSGTRKEEKLYAPHHMLAIHKMRRVLSGVSPQEAMEGLLHMLYKYPTNEDALAALASTVRSA